MKKLSGIIATALSVLAIGFGVNWGYVSHLCDLAIQTTGELATGEETVTRQFVDEVKEISVAKIINPALTPGDSPENPEPTPKSKYDFDTPVSLEEALEILETSGVRPGQTEISLKRLGNAIDEIKNHYDASKATSSVYTDETTGEKFYVEGHHTTIAFIMLGKSSSFNMNLKSPDPPSTQKVYWTKKWYQFGRQAIQIVEE